MSSGRKVLVVGLGSAGCRFLDTCMDHAGDGFPEHVAIHTDEQVLDNTAVERRLLLGASLLQGESTGGCQGLGKQAAESDRENLNEILAGVDILFLVTGLGGGTGTGAAPLLAAWARECGAIVICFAIQPFFFEGSVKRSQAEKGLRELRDAASAVVQLSNQSIYNWADESTGVKDAFERINVALLHNLTAMIDLLVSPGIVANVRFTDFEAMLRHSGGICTMGYGEGVGETRINDAIAALVANPVLGKDNIIKTASGLIVGIIGGQDMTVHEVGRIMEEIPALAPENARISMGAVLRSGWRERIGIAVFASEKWEETEEERQSDGPPEGDEEKDTPSSTKRRRKRQSRLALQPKGKGFFNDIEPTLFEGEDLDVPTFQRRNIRLG